MSEYQLSLVVFTVFCQWSIGSVLAVTIYRSLSDATGSLWQPRSAASLIWLVCLIGSFASFGHLGSPMEAYNALRGVGHSWLSREVVAFFILNGCMTLWMLSHYVNTTKHVQQLLGAITSVVGLVAILVSAQVYFQLQSHAEWNTMLTHLTFLSTALTLGMATVILFICASNQVVPATIRYLLGFSVLMTFVVMTLFALRVDSLASHNLLTAYQVLGSILAGTLLFMMVRDSSRYKPEWVFAVMLVMVSGEFVGRMSFYSSVMSKIPW